MGTMAKRGCHVAGAMAKQSAAMFGGPNHVQKQLRRARRTIEAKTLFKVSVIVRAAIAPSRDAA